MFWRKRLRERKFDRTLFINRFKDELLVVEIYVDDFIFRATSSGLALSFAEEMKIEFEMRRVGELTFFLGLQIRQLKDEIFLSQSKYAKELVKKFGLESSKHFRTPMNAILSLARMHLKKILSKSFIKVS